MPENQNIEWKSSWRDEYLKWICGFANAQGGKIYIGKDDNGKVTGIADYKQLMNDIPNKVKDILGILVDVNLHTEAEGNYIEIIVEAYPYPVNYKGQYHYRSGGTKQELKGASLDKFLLERKGKRWDAVPVPNISVSDFKQETFDFFRKRALKSKRIEEDVLTDTNEQLIENLQLKENDFLKRASILLFHSNPEKFVTGAYVKIGFFESDAELKYQDEIHGNLFEQIEKTMDLLFTKYIKAEITYEGIHRIETYEYPKEAIREALLNAITHKDYSGGAPVQISVYKDKIMFWNDGQLPENWTVENLIKKHPSRPYNPDIANAFFRSGHIESWGRGTIKMIERCTEAGVPTPSFSYEMPGIWVEFVKQLPKDVLTKKGLPKHLIEIILFTEKNGRVTNSDVQSICNITKRTATRYLNSLQKSYLIKIGVKKGTYYELKK